MKNILFILLGFIVLCIVAHFAYNHGLISGQLAQLANKLPDPCSQGNGNGTTQPPAPMPAASPVAPAPDPNSIYAQLFPTSNLLNIK